MREVRVMTLRETFDRALLSSWGGRIINLILVAAVFSGGYLLLRPLFIKAKPATDAARTAAPERTPVRHPQIDKVEPSAKEHLEEVRDAWNDTIGVAGVDRIKQAHADAELGRVYLAYNFPESAASCFTNAELFDPGDYRWPYLLAEAQYLASEAPLAAASMERAVQQMKGDLTLPREHYVAALSFLGDVWGRLGNEKRATEVYKELLALNEQSLLARFELGRLALNRGDYDAAAESLEKALAVAPRHPAIRQALATAYRGSGQVEKVAELTEGLGAEPSRGISWADPLMAQVRNLNRSSFNLVQRAMRERRAGKLPLAIQLLEAAVQTSPENANAWINLGVSYLDANQIEAAKKAYVKAEELGSNAGELQIGIALAALQQGTELESAVIRLERVILNDPGNSGASFTLAAVEMRLGKIEPALNRLQQILKAQPNNPQARLAEARCLFTLKRFTEARQGLEAGHTLTVTSAPLADALARFLATCPEESLRDASRAVELAEGVWEQVKTIPISETLAMALAEAGRFDDAVKQQEKTLLQIPAGTSLDVRERIQSNLQRYRDKQPCRDPWPESDKFPAQRLGGRG